MRLDKWLWCARFYKTRKLATEAISGGKVHLQGQRTKPGRDISPGSQIEIHKQGLTWNIEVAVLPKQRRPAAEAKFFYTESDESVALRQQQTAELRAVRAAESVKTPGRPTKRDRRLIHRFKQDSNG